MDREQILEAIQNLAMSQGFYGRLYERLTDGTDRAEQALNYLEEQKFGDVADMVIFLES